MDIQSVKSFVMVANLGSFTKAAESMNYAQSTVTMQIQRLEEELGFPLFERIGQKNYLTSGGQEFLSHAVDMLHIIQKMSMAGQDIKSMKGTLRVGLLESLFFAGILPILHSFQNDFPNVSIHFKIGQASELLSLLKQNQLDIIYISNALNSDPTIHCCYCRREEMAFIANPGHPLAQRRAISIHELWEYPFILAEKTGCCHSRLSEVAIENDLTLNCSVLIDNISAIASLINDAHSITFLPEYSLHPELDKGKLVKLDVDLPPQIYYSQLLHHKNKWLSPFMQSFIEHIHLHRPEGALAHGK